MDEQQYYVQKLLRYIQASGMVYYIYHTGDISPTMANAICDDLKKVTFNMPGTNISLHLKVEQFMDGQDNVIYARIET